MNYSKIRNLDIANGPGCRITIFCSGCTNCCPGCFQPETWDFNYGKEFTEDTLNSILELAKPSYIAGLSILGGEPAHPRNFPEILKLARKFKEVYPEKDIWLWTGYLIEEVFEDLIDSGIDVVVDGKFVEELKDLRLKYRGSTNQRVIDLKETIKTGDLILYE
jgi:anaerobic ribonucleoside-triphosphate reductase activating protein